MSELADEIKIKYKPVMCDDRGDINYNWYATYWLHGKCIWSDYYHTKPTATQAREMLEEHLRDGCLLGIRS